MPDMTRRIVLELLARNKAAAELASFNHGIDNVYRGLQRMATGILTVAGIGGGLYGLKRGLESVVGAAMQQEKAEMDLAAALGGTQDALRQVKNQFAPFASSLQKLTIYGDEQILSQMAYAKNLGITTDRIEEATKAAIGLAARYRIDLESAMMLVGRASQGQTQMLTRYGIIIDATLTPQEKFNELLKIGAESFRLAEAEAKTSAGTMTQLRNEFGDLKEEIGKGLLPAVIELAKTLKSLAGTYRVVVELEQKWLKTPGAESILEKVAKPFAFMMEEKQKGQARKWLERYGARIPGTEVRKTLGLSGISAISGDFDRLTAAAEEFHRQEVEINDQMKEWYEGTQQLGDLEDEFQFWVDDLERVAEEEKRAAIGAGMAADQWDSWTSSNEKLIESLRRTGGVIDENAIRLKAMRENILSIKSASEILLEAGMTFKQGFGEAFADVLLQIRTLEDAFRQLAISVSRSILTNIGQNIAANMLEGVSRAIFGSPFPVEAKGGAFGPQGIIPMARGGLVDKAMLFPFARGVGLMGEKGPEAVMPLARDSQGRLGVHASAGNGRTDALLSQILAALEKRQTINASIVDKRNVVTREQMESRDGEQLVMYHVTRNR